MTSNNYTEFLNEPQRVGWLKQSARLAEIWSGGTRMQHHLFRNVVASTAAAPQLSKHKKETKKSVIQHGGRTRFEITSTVAAK